MLYSDKEINQLVRAQYPDPYYITFLKELKKKIKERGFIGLFINQEQLQIKEEKEVNKFHKVSIEQYIRDYLKLFPSESIGETAMIEEIYEKIKMPKRSTSGSAGYDFYLPTDIHLKPTEDITIPTGIKCEIEPRWFLSLYPRSGLGFKYQLHLATCVSVIDSDYFDNESNEGHILAKLINNGTKNVDLSAGDAFMQSIFLPYGLVVDDETDGIRKGGMGSTDKDE